MVTVIIININKNVQTQSRLWTDPDLILLSLFIPNIIHYYYSSY